MFEYYDLHLNLLDIMTDSYSRFWDGDLIFYSGSKEEKKGV